VLNIWDCSGKNAFYESYFEHDCDTIFCSVKLLIYIFDIKIDFPENDLEHFAGVLEAIEESSPDAHIYFLVHKMDLVTKEEHLYILEEQQVLINLTCRRCGVWKSKLKLCL